MTRLTYQQLAMKLKALGVFPHHELTDSGHGTHVAGIIAGAGHNPTPLPHYLWVNPKNGRAVVIPDLGQTTFSGADIDRICERLDIRLAA